jgi:hypothetical protein
MPFREWAFGKNSGAEPPATLALHAACAAVFLRPARNCIFLSPVPIPRTGERRGRPSGCPCRNRMLLRLPAWRRLSRLSGSPALELSSPEARDMATSTAKSSTTEGPGMSFWRRRVSSQRDAANRCFGVRLLAGQPASGEITWKTAPCGSPGDADSVPPWDSIIERQIARPIPMP